MSASTTSTISVPEGTLSYTLALRPSPSPHLPALLFLHAGVTDATAWAQQLAHFSARGWTCLAPDRFGFGASQPSAAFLATDPRPRVDFAAHWAAAIDATLPAEHRSVVVIGLSMGGGSALEFAIVHPERVAGLVVVAGGVHGFECAVPDAETALFHEEERLTKAGDVEGLAQLQAQFWGDGPLQPKGRVDPVVRAKLLAWTRDNSAREVNGTGGWMRGEEVSVLDRLGEIKVPTAVAWGTYDETHTNEAMKHIAQGIKGATLREFRTAHMVNLEDPEGFDKWLEEFLDEHFGE